MGGLLLRSGITASALALLFAGCDAAPPARVDAQSPAPIDPVDFTKHERRVFSQFGEDGIIEEIFRRIEPTSRFAVEFGAGDGVQLSNVRNLFVHHGWSGLLIEGDEALAAKLKTRYAANPRVETLQAWVYPGNIEALFEDNGVPLDLDFLVIDIDSNDYWGWRSCTSFVPRWSRSRSTPSSRLRSSW